MAFNRRPAFAAYGGGSSFSSASSSRQARNEPPDLDFDNRSRVTLADLESSARARNREMSERALTNRVMQKIREQQEMSVYGQKVVSLDSDDDEDTPIMQNAIQSVFDEQRVHVVYVREDKKKKKHRHRSSSTSSSSSDSSDSSRKKSSRRKKRKEKKRKKEKKERKRKHETEDEESQEEQSSSSRRKKIREIETEFDARKNPWSTLRKHEFLQYKPHYVVIDTRSDYQNLNYDYTQRGTVPEFRPINHENSLWRAFCQQCKSLFSESEQSSAIKQQDRFFSDRIMKNWDRNPPERIFRNKASEKHFRDETKLSHVPCDELEEDTKPAKPELDEQLASNIDLDEYMHCRRGQQTSYEEALETSLENRYSILKGKVTTDPDDIDAWLLFIDIQREVRAKDETGDSNAPIQNKKAYYEIVEAIIKSAMSKVSRKNPKVAELEMKRLKLMEEFYGANSEIVISEWKMCENRYVNNLSMWRENIAMRQNDRAVFKLKHMVLLGSEDVNLDNLPLIDRCFSKLVAVRDGIILSHQPLEGTEQFLVELLVQRCALLIATGYIDKAVAMLQALAEFHFFRPSMLDFFRSDVKPQQRLKKTHEEFKKFWDSGVPRVGEQSANGWCNFEERDLLMMEPETQEADRLDEQWQFIQDEQNKQVEGFKSAGLSPLDARRRLEKFRTKFYWSPVHFEHDDEKIYEHKSRIVRFEELRPVLFTFNDKSCAQDLIFKLLHVLGVPIPGVPIETQESVLRQFSRSNFASNSPNTLRLHEFEKFIENLVCQLAETELMDEVRIYPALVTVISHSGLDQKERYEALKKMIRSDIPTRMRYAKETKLSIEVQCALYLAAVEEMAKIREEGPKIKDTLDYVVSSGLLKVNLDMKKLSIWEIKATKPTDEEFKRRERLLFLRFAVFMARQLPFSTEPNANAPPQQQIKTQNSVNLSTKREFLLSLWYHGKVKEVQETPETVATAFENVAKHLRTPAPLKIDDPFRWIGDENEMVFELASYFVFEFPIDNIPMNRFDQFIADNSDLYESRLGKLLSDRPGPQETRVRILKHILSTTVYYTPKEFHRKLFELAQRFPHNVPILKALLDVGSEFDRQSFLGKFPGTDDRSRLVRTCGRVYTAFNKYRKEAMRYQKQNFDDKAVQALLAQFVNVLKKAADQDHQKCGNMLPDDYIWIFLMRVMTLDGKDIEIPARIVDEIFTLGQGRCPWSKQFLLTSLIGHSSLEDPFVSMVKGLMQTHGIRAYCTDAEIELLMTGQ